jgi:hypothetical protein
MQEWRLRSQAQGLPRPDHLPLVIAMTITILPRRLEVQLMVDHPQEAPGMVLGRGRRLQAFVLCVTHRDIVVSDVFFASKFLIVSR